MADRTPWEANREVLAKRFPALLARLEAAARPAGLQIFDARSGEPAARSGDALLCSQYEPRVEGAALAGTVAAEGLMHYAVLGLGMAYHVEALFESASPESLILVVESDPGLARAVLEARDLSRLLASPRVHLFASPDPADLFEFLEPHLVFLFMGLKRLQHPPSLRRAPEAFAALEKALMDFVQYGQTSMVTATTIAYSTKQNLCMNLADYAFSRGVEALRDAWKGRPAVVIAAGPSLGRQLPQLKAVKGKALLIAVGTALKPCLKAGVVPDFTATLDYSRLSAKYLEGVEDYPPVPLVTDPKGNWQAVAAYPGPKYFIDNPYLDILTGRLLGADRGQLDTGGTVAHLSYSLARHLGADPVIFVGLDLAYTHHVTHLPGTAIHDQWGPELNRFNTLEGREWEQLARMGGRLRELPAQGGGTVGTDEQMFYYLQKFQNDWRKAGHRVIDATEGGARKENAEALPLAEALAACAAADGPPLPLPPLPDREALREPLLEVLDRRLEENAAVSGICRDAMKRLKRIRDRFEDPAYVTKQIQALQKEKQAMEGYKLMNELVGELIQSNEFLKTQRDKEIAARRLEGRERLKAQLERDLEYVTGLSRGTEQLGHMLRLARAGVAAHPARVPWTDPP